MSDDTGRTTGHNTGHTNALAGESSPYLRLHQHNPVDWHPWGEKALVRAVEEDRPIFLSVGYSTCYWCHVMERESFSDPGIAALMNEHFVNIKVDREERPDIDEIYMVATQVLIHQGGWPNSVFLTPALEPFFAGTYFPPEDQHGRPGFRTVLRSLADAWVERRDDVGEQGASVVGAIRHYFEERDGPTENPPGALPAKRSLATLERQFDAQWGGFGGAPKFPSVPNLWVAETFAGEAGEARRMLDATLDQMARGGIYDQLAGGFHRYATDAEWKIPHFEKMLYDNGLLLELYARHAERSGSEQSKRIVDETVRFLQREMQAEGGAFWSAIDAETDGHEGAYYVWTQEELIDVLGREDAAFLAPILGFQGAPFFEQTHYVLHWPDTLEAQAERRHEDPGALFGEVRPLLDRLLEVRTTRDRPATDEKVLADWNGTAIAGLTEAGRVSGDPLALRLASEAAEFVWTELRTPKGVLLHSWHGGQGRIEAFLSDYAFLTHGLLALHRATGDDKWLERSIALVEEQEERLASPEGAFFAAAEGDDLIVRSQDVFDGALPSSSGLAVANLLRLAERTSDTAWRSRAEKALCAHGALIEKRPEAVRTLALAAASFAPESTRPAHSQTEAELRDARDEPVAVDLRLTPAATDESARDENTETHHFELSLQISTGWHVYANEQTLAWVPRTELAARDAELTAVAYPPGAVGPEEGVEIYAGHIVISGACRVAGPEPTLTLTYQACDDTRCLSPATLDVRIGS